MKYIGIYIAVISLFCLFYFPIIRTYPPDKGIIIDKYKGKTSEEDSDGILIYNDMLYLTIKYNNGLIERRDVDENIYYNNNIGNQISFPHCSNLTLIGFLSILGIFIGIFFIFVNYDYY